MLLLSSLQSFIASHPFAELAILVMIVVIVTALMRLLRQPLIIGYIIAGIVMSPSLLNILQHTENVQMFAHIGVALLLFMVWLWINPRIIKDLGKVSLLLGLGQVVITIALWFWIARWFWFDLVTSMYISLALTFSSTIIIVKLLSDRGVADELYGKISLWVLIVQDIIAMIILMILASLPSAGVAIARWSFVSLLLLKIVVVVIVSFILTTYILPWMMKHVAKSQEFLLIFAVAWCLFAAAAMEAFGFSLEIGALIAGLTMASLPYRFEIESKMKPLRDFFIMLFFVFLGSQLDFSQLWWSRWLIVIFSFFVLVVKPLIIFVLMRLLGYTSKNSLFVWSALAQVSEFSFILISVVLALGHVTDASLLSFVTMVGLISIAWSSYYIISFDKIYAFLKPYLWSSSKGNSKNIVSDKEVYDTIVFGNHRTGDSIVRMLAKHKKRFSIIDYDPQVIDALQKQWLPCMFGDACDSAFLDELPFAHAMMIVSTVHDYAANALILRHAKHAHPSVIAIMSAHDIHNATLLYEQGADYVIVPHMIGGQHTAMLIESFDDDIERYAQHKIEHYAILQETTKQIGEVLEGKR